LHAVRARSSAYSALGVSRLMIATPTDAVAWRRTPLATYWQFCTSSRKPSASVKRFSSCTPDSSRPSRSPSMRASTSPSRSRFSSVCPTSISSWSATPLAAGVDDVREAVDVDVEQRRVAAVVAAPVHFLRQRLVEMARVVEPGQRVVRELPPHAVRALALGDVAEDDDGAFAAPADREREHRAFDRRGLAAGAPEHRLVRGQRLAFGVRAVERGFARVDRAAVLGRVVEQRVRRLADQRLVVRMPEQPQRGRVDEADVAFRVDAVHAVADRAEDAVEALLLGRHLLLHLDLARERADACDEELHRLVLEHALDGTGLEAALDDVLLVRARDDREHRVRGGRRVAQAPAELVAVAVGQEVVDDRQVVAAVLRAARSASPIEPRVETWKPLRSSSCW
jgi:hypothetical protein